MLGPGRGFYVDCRAKNRGQKSRDTNPLPKYGTFCPQKQKHKKHAKDKFFLFNLLTEKLEYGGKTGLV